MSTTITVDGRVRTFGDTSGALAQHAHGGDDTLIGNAFFLSAYGDAWAITGSAVGGDDYVVALSNSSGTGASAFGDAETISGHGHGGDDTVGASGTQVGGSRVFGDAREMSDHAVGGNDLLLFGRLEYGDAQTLSGHVRCGDDTLNGGSYGTFGSAMYGDGQTASGHVQCGNDVLIANPGTVRTTMYGDGESLLGHAHGGNDVLISSSGNEIMWGDAAVVGPHATTGADRFVFSPPNGHDQIMDFQPGKDHIELHGFGFGFGGFKALATHFQTTPDGVLISFDANDDILVRGVTVSQLHAGDFILA